MNKFNDNAVDTKILTISAFLVFAGILLRLHFINHVALDMTDYLYPWFDFIKSNGALFALGQKFSNYAPAYTYLLTLVTFLPVDKIVAIKLISIFADIFNSLILFVIIKDFTTRTSLSVLGAALFWCLPTVMLNSAMWGQCDSVYTSFLLLSFYFAVKNRPFFTIFFFSVAFAFKLQAVFFLPFLSIYLLRECQVNLKLVSFFIFCPIITYFVFALPTVLLGRSLSEVMMVYASQADTYKAFSLNFPNLYFFLGDSNFAFRFKVAILFAGLIALCWVISSVRYKVNAEDKFKFYLLTAALSFSLLTQVLPTMHERYMYPAEVFSLLIPFFTRKLWFVPVLFQLITVHAYSRHLLGFFHNKLFDLTAVICFFLVAYLVYQHYLIRQKPSFA